MFRTIRNLFVIALIGVMATSCLKSNSGNEEVVTQQSFSQYIGFVNNKSTGESSSITALGLTLYINYTESTAQVDITGLKIGSSTYPTISLEDISWKSDKAGFVELKAASIVPSANGLQIPTVTNFEGKLVERLFDSLASTNNPEGYWPNLTLHFVMDGQYEVLISSALQIYEGTLVSTSESGATYTNTKPLYTATIDAEKRVLAIRMNSVQFIEGMPAMDIDIPGLPYVVDGTDLKFNSESIVPTIKDTPYPPYTLTEVTGEVELEDGLELQFVCNPPQLGKFTVKIDAPFESKSQSK